MTNQDFEWINNASNHRIDLSYLKEFSHGDRAFEKDMLESSLIETEEKLLLLRKSITERKFERMKAVAHSLKSLMSIIGSQHLYQCFYNLEHCDEQMDAESLIQRCFCSIIENWNEIKIKVEEKVEEYSLDYECR